MERSSELVLPSIAIATARAHKLCALAAEGQEVRGDQRQLDGV